LKAGYKNRHPKTMEITLKLSDPHIASAQALYVQ